jgi:6-phosphogluconolactonase (cycloisomerase 2 family)
LVIAEAAEGVTGESTVSSYSVQGGGALGSISAAVPNSQTAACWIAVTPNRRYVYVSNTESGQVSSYRLRPDGSIELLESTASNTPAASSPIDLAVSRDGQNLYVHQAGRQAIAVFGIEADGQLTRRRPITDLPSGAQGLAVY